jgi:hypothetical protein
VKLPKLNLINFSGNILEFESFWDLFKSAVHDNKKLSAIQKFQYLKGQRSDGVLKLIEGHQLVASNYQVVVDKLLSQYQQPNRIIELHISKLLDIKKTQYNYAEIHKFTADLECHLHSLRAHKIGVDCQSCNILLGNIVANKLPDKFKEKLRWKKLKDAWDVEIILDSLSNALIVLADEKSLPNAEKTKSASYKSQNENTSKLFKSTNARSSTLTVNNQTETASQNSNNVGSSNVRPRFCSFCRGQHFTANCTVYSTVNARYQQAKNNSLCFNCLSS